MEIRPGVLSQCPFVVEWIMDIDGEQWGNVCITDSDGVCVVDRLECMMWWYGTGKCVNDGGYPWV